MENDGLVLVVYCGKTTTTKTNVTNRGLEFDTRPKTGTASGSKSLDPLLRKGGICYLSFSSDQHTLEKGIIALTSPFFLILKPQYLIPILYFNTILPL